MRTVILIFGLAATAAVAAQQAPNPRQQPGASVTMFAPEQHDLYDGHFILSATRIYMVGGLKDAPGWDHMDNAAATLRPAAGTVEIDVDEIKNTGKFEARLKIPEGDLVVAFDRFREFKGKSCRVEKSTRLHSRSTSIFAVHNRTRRIARIARSSCTFSAWK